MRYENIAFFHFDSATVDRAKDAFGLLDMDGPKAAIAYLAKWHYPGEHEVTDGEPWGLADTTVEVGDYVLSYNRPLGYIALYCKVI